MWGFGLKSPTPRASQSPLGPKRNNNVQVAEETLTCFPLLCLWLFPQPLEKPFGKEGGGKGSKAPREIGCGGAGCTAPPVLPTCARVERCRRVPAGPGSTHSASELPGFCRD